MMQRDEGAMLMAWLSYYGQIFGFGNLVIFDNGSTDPLTLHLLDQAARCGATIRRDHKLPDDFHGKGRHFAREIRQWDRLHNYDFALPVDCDEFLVVADEEGISTSSAKIHAEFARLHGEKSAFRIGGSFFNVPGKPGWFAFEPEFIKGFVAARTVGVVDNGQHNPASRVAPGYVLTRFVYLHWHNHDYAEMRGRARVKLSNSLVDPDDRAALMRYAITPNLPGRHLVSVLLEDEAHYRDRYNGMLHLYLPWAGSPSALPVHVENGPSLLADGRVSRQWSGQRYLEMNGDVAGWPPGALMHFLVHGWAEGRQF
ncbi:hypothetical protein C0V97_03100 [Asaia sp. W19]|uniref:glycosyltransferase family 2 protein n=1 Tax=unclassified Asaia TaxID=2685023 RepID=UPI000F8EE59D|nr:glycosyltransferase family 2 protein [Asaia sp. W19]RUT27215.1 hypothetical protein C0V97_03100 [Asaia sp. W19]